MAKKYKDVDGMWLDIDDSADELTIRWFGEEFGAGAGLDTSAHSGDDHGAASASVKALACGTNKDQEFVFASLAKAKRALSAANAALLAFQTGLPWPEWATRALDEGWKPPKCWAPTYDREKTK